MTTYIYGKLIPCGHTHYTGCDPCGCDEWFKVELDTVTITISREDAEALGSVGVITEHRYHKASANIAGACRAALEAQHEYDTSPELQALLRHAALEGERWT